MKTRPALCFFALFAFTTVHSLPVHADVLSDIKRGARKAGQAIERGVEDTGEAIGRGARRLGQGLQEGFCDTFTDKSDAQCRAESGVGYDKKGAYTYDPNNPARKYRGNETDQAATDREKHLSKFAEYVANKELTPAEIQDRDVYHFRRFLLPNAKLGEPFPNADKDLKSPTKSGAIRPCCLKGGGGGFLTDRLDKDKLRFQGGSDYLTTAGEPIYATIDGWVEEQKNPRKEFEGIVLRNKAGYRVSIYFVALAPEVKQALKDHKQFEVKAGETVLGHAQDLHPAYPPEVANHVYVIMSDPKGNPVDPAGKIKLDRAPKSIPKSS